MINLYPAQMRDLAEMCEALDAVKEKTVQFGRIEVRDGYGTPLGWLVDEAGGSFSWAPPEWFSARGVALPAPTKESESDAD